MTAGHCCDAQYRTEPPSASLHSAVASLGLVSPGAATDGVTPIFPLKTGDRL